MSTMPVQPHYPTVAPFPIADVETALGLIESVIEELDPAEVAAIGRLRLTLVAAEQAQARARSEHPSLEGLDPAQEDAGNVAALGVASHAAGHVTEVAAAERIRLTANTLRAKVLAALVEAGPDGLTDVEVEDRLGLRRPTGGNRRGELVKLGLVAKVLDAGGAAVTRVVEGHGPACTWAATEAAIPALRELGYCVDVIAGDLFGWDVATVTGPGDDVVPLAQ